jgi:hypothetical protein
MNDLKMATGTEIRNRKLSYTRASLSQGSLTQLIFQCTQSDLDSDNFLKGVQ